MSSINNKAIQGNLSVSRDHVVGGNMHARGNSQFDHNVVIKGWLDARNIKGPCKGLYSSEDALKKAYPNPMPGWYALVGNTLPAYIYRTDGGEWVGTDEKGGEVNLYLDQLEQDVDDLNDEVKDIQELIGTGMLAKIEFDSTATSATLTYRLRKPDGTETEHNVTVPIVSAEKAGMMTSADKRKLDSINGSGLATIDISKLDSLYSMDALIGKKPLRYIVTAESTSGTFPIGVLDMFSDNMGHMFTQVLTTHYSFGSGGIPDFTGHEDNNVFTYWRSYHVGGGTSTTPVGTWGEWKLYYSSKSMGMLRNAIDRDFVKNVQKGVARGVAELDEDGKVPLNQLPESISEEVTSIPIYSGTVTGITARILSLQSPRHVLYDTDNNVFVATMDDVDMFGPAESYANNWEPNEAEGILSADKYGTFTEKGRKPVTNRIYIDTRNKSIGYYDKGTGKIIGIPCSINAKDINNICV